MKFNKIKQNLSFSPNGIMGILFCPGYFCSKHLVKNIKKYASDLEGKLLDFGCGSKPYQLFFENVQEYIGLDFENEGHNHSNESIDIFYDGRIIPFEDETFDCVLSTQVFEHVKDIELTISELYRVLKKDGKILITVPFVFPEHELPHDYRRFTQIGLSDFLANHGFEVLSTTKNGNFQEVVWQLRILYIRDIIRVKNKYLNFVLRTLVVPPMIILGIICSAIFPKRDSLYFDITILARKSLNY